MRSYLNIYFKPPKMKIELIRKTTKIFGTVYYYVTVDGAMQSVTWTTDLEAANKSLSEIIESCKKYPEDVYETLKVQIL